jgi:hypothetical protein
MLVNDEASWIAKEFLAHQIRNEAGPEKDRRTPSVLLNSGRDQAQKRVSGGKR